jgi:hypothetical protein
VEEKKGQFGFHQGGKLTLEGTEVGTWKIEIKKIQVSAMGNIYSQ